PEDQRERARAEQEADDDNRYSSHPIRQASGDRFRHHGEDQLRAKDDRDLGVVEAYFPGVDWQEAEKSPVAQIHHGFDPGGHEDRWRLEDFGDPLPELRHPRGESLRLRLWTIDIRKQQYRKQRKHAEHANREIGHGIA